MAKSGLVGKKEYLEIRNHMKYFLRYFLKVNSFTLNFWGSFRALNPKSCDLLC